MVNLINAERVTMSYGTRTLLDRVSLGLNRGEVIGVVGRNGAGKTTLLRILAGIQTPDSGRVIHSRHPSIGFLKQADAVPPDASVRDVIVDGAPDHLWAADSGTRVIVEHLLADVDLDAQVGSLSGGERRRVALVEVLLADHDLLILDEPTNHLDVEAIDWLAIQLNDLQAAGVAMLIVSHDRWLLDAVCNRIWEVHDGQVHGYDGGYAAYVLARAERERQAAITAARRKNLLRKELAWLRRGPPARTSKPKFRLDAAATLIADEPEPRDRLQLQRFATARLGKDVFDLDRVSMTLGGRPLLREISWSIGPGMRIAVIGVNGSGKTTLLRLLAGVIAPDSGTIKRGKTLRVGYLSQALDNVDGTERVLESIDNLRRQARLATGAEASARSLLEDFGFTGDKLTARLDDLSGGEQRRLQILRVLLDEPNVLLLDEPTNDLDIETLTVIEDYLDGWPGTLLVVTHDRYFLERVCDVSYALLGDGSCVLLPGGVDQYLTSRREQPSEIPPAQAPDKAQSATPSAATRKAKKELARLEQQITRVDRQLSTLHEEMAAAASDYQRLAELQRELELIIASKEQLELAWLEAADIAG
ncbi:MAG TPA: ABC-F family ATP-binding cassette domain-containing protein [Propionibacteriaceae bacterium]|nr:ABC-F family ATP-binding cassette domain-containing protein [Propionibacteriaceae bacterium]